MCITRMLKTAVLSALASLAASSLTLAHHGAVTQPSLYLTDDFVELRGEIVDVLWRNPHTRARMLVAGDDGGEQLWEIEISPGPRTLERLGINEEDLFGPARAAGYISRRDPDSLGALHVLLPDGREYAQGNRANCSGRATGSRAHSSQSTRKELQRSDARQPAYSERGDAESGPGLKPTNITIS